MLTLPITVGKKYVRRDGKTITALPTTDIPALAAQAAKLKEIT